MINVSNDSECIHLGSLGEHARIATLFRPYGHLADKWQHSPVDDAGRREMEITDEWLLVAKAFYDEGSTEMAREIVGAAVLVFGFDEVREAAIEMFGKPTSGGPVSGRMTFGRSGPG